MATGPAPIRPLALSSRSRPPRARQSLGVGARRTADHAQRELEAESGAYLVCARNVGSSKSKHTWLLHCPNTTVECIDLYRVMRAAGKVETLLDLAAHARF